MGKNLSEFHNPHYNNEQNRNKKAVNNLFLFADSFFFHSAKKQKRRPA